MSFAILGSEWHLSPDGINIVTDNGAIKDPKAALKRALDTDLKSLGKSALLSALSNNEIGKLVLQIQKIRNISAPKAKEDSQAAPRMLKLTLTDGESYVQAIEVSPINAISREKTAPGTKVLIEKAKIVSGYLLIEPQNFTVLGGQVKHLYEKWLLAKSIQQSHRAALSTGAPLWVPFGSKISVGGADGSFKALEKGKEQDGNSEFDLQRKEAIAVASTGAIKKTFGGRVKQNVQPMQNNQQGRGAKLNDQSRGRKGRFASREDDTMEQMEKPSEKVSLFSFLEDKLPVSEPVKKGGYDFNRQNIKHFENSETGQQFNMRGQDGKHAATSNNVHNQNGIHYPKGNTNDYRNNFNYRSEDSHRNSQPRYLKEERQSGPPNHNQNQKDASHFKTYDNSFGLKNANRTRNDAPRNNYKPLKSDPPERVNEKIDNAEMHQLANSLSRMSVSNEFASRSLRQHLNLNSRPPPKAKATASTTTTAPEASFLNVGDQCLAKYWEDGKFYPATITAVTDKTYAVRFEGYGNIEEVLKVDCFVAANNTHGHHPNKNQQPHQNSYSGSSMEFRSRRGPPRN